MKELTETIRYYKCEYCGYTNASAGMMATHEAEHKRVEALAIGQKVIYNFDSGYTRVGKVVEKDVKQTRFLVEALSGERDWTYFSDYTKLIP